MKLALISVSYMYLAFLFFEFPAGLSENLALNKPASQSSDLSPLCHAGLAVDGNDETNFNIHFCSHTEKEADPWWTVDLLDTYAVTSLTIINRASTSCDSGSRCANRLVGFKVHVSESLLSRFQKLCYASTATSLPLEIHLTCTSTVVGQYVTVSLTGTQFLTLCEVEVFGFHPAERFTTQTLTFEPSPLLASSSHISGFEGKHVGSSRTFDWNEYYTLHPYAGGTQRLPKESVATKVLCQEVAAQGTVNDSSLNTSTLDKNVKLPRIRISNVEELTAVNNVPSAAMSNGESNLWLETRASEMTTTRQVYEDDTATSMLSNILSTQMYPAVIHIYSSLTPESVFSGETHVHLRTSFDGGEVRTGLCYCFSYKLTQKSIVTTSKVAFMSSVMEALEINTRNLSRQRMRYTSIADNRKSALSIGWVSLAVIVVPLVCLLVSDVAKITDDIKSRHRLTGAKEKGLS